MHICIICEVSQKDIEFPDFGPICRNCVAYLVKSYGVEYASPKRQSRLESHLALLLAIRRQAELDDDLGSFERNWLYRSPWNQILNSVKDAVITAEELSNEIQLMVSQVEGP